MVLLISALVVIGSNAMPGTSRSQSADQLVAVPPGAAPPCNASGPAGGGGCRCGAARCATGEHCALTTSQCSHDCDWDGLLAGSESIAIPFNMSTQVGKIQPSTQVTNHCISCPLANAICCCTQVNCRVVNDEWSCGATSCAVGALNTPINWALSEGTGKVVTVWGQDFNFDPTMQVHMRRSARPPTHSALTILIC